MEEKKGERPLGVVNMEQESVRLVLASKNAKKLVEDVYKRQG